MHSFRDCAGHAWELSIGLGEVKAVKGSPLAVDLLRPYSGNPKLIVRLRTDLEFVSDLIWLLVASQAAELNLSQADWEQKLGGQAVTDATEALYKELIDFYRLHLKCEIPIFPSSI